MINKLVEKVVKDISKKHKDVIVNFKKSEIVDNVLITLKYYNKKSFIEFPIADIYRSSFPENYVSNLIEERIKELLSS